MSARSNDWEGHLKRRHDEDIRAMRVLFLQYLLTQPNHTGSVDAIRPRVTVTANPVMLGLVTRGGIGGLLEPVGWKQSVTGGCHSRPIKAWRLRDATAVDRWIKDNPPKEVPHVGIANAESPDDSSRGSPDNDRQEQ